MQLRTLFGTLPLKSPRLHQCACQLHTTKTYSPLAAVLPEHITPERLFLETKWAALASYGVTVQLLQDVLPIDEPLHAFTIRQHVYKVAERLEYKPWGKNNGRSLTVVLPSGAVCPSRMAR